MNNPMITSPSSKTTEQETRKPDYNGLFLVSSGVSRNDRPASGSAQITPNKGLALATGKTSEAPQSSEVLEARSAESIRMKLAACFGAILTAPVVWCLHTLVLSLPTR